MIVNIYGLPPSCVNTKNLLEEAAKFYANILLEKDVIKHIELDIEIVYDKEYSGHCVTEEDKIKPNVFTIYLNPEYEEFSIFDTLAHEMVHLKQFTTDELYNILAMDNDDINLGHVWKGERYVPQEGEILCLEAPWEQEAYGRQVGLYYRWMNRKVDEE